MSQVNLICITIMGVLNQKLGMFNVNTVLKFVFHLPFCMIRSHIMKALEVEAPINCISP
jgi:hypothetical protein